MATFKVDGIDDVMAVLNQAGSELRPIIEEALRQSAEVVREKMVAEEMNSFKAPSGELGGFIHVGPVWHNSSDSAINAYIRGDGYVGVRGKARRAGMVAGLVQNKHGNPWVKRAMSKSRKRVNAIIMEALGGDNA